MFGAAAAAPAVRPDGGGRGQPGWQVGSACPQILAIVIHRFLCITYKLRKTYY